MKQDRFSGTVSVFALVLGLAWTQMKPAIAASFTPPADNTAPREGTGGASRSSFFTPPADNTAPREGTGGASRDSFFTPPADSSAPQEGTGGASRGSFFIPPADSSAPQEATSGASRGDFFAPPSDATPHGSAGGASRGLFEGTDEVVATSSGNDRGNVYGGVTAAMTSSAAASMLAVMPDSFYGTTLEARPTILVYIPASDADTAIFSLKNEAKDLIFQMTLAVPATGGVVAIEMPDESPELTVSENYQWYVAIRMDDELTPASPFVDGWIKRIEPSSDMALALAQGDALSNIETLGANGVWYDTASRLASLQGAQANETMANHWHELLESIGLASIATEPIWM